MSEPRRENEMQARLAELNVERQTVEDQLNRERLLRVTNELINAMTSPEFIEKMRLARSVSDTDSGVSAVARLLSIDGLRASGVDIPPDLRLTSRVFEDIAEGFRLEIKSGTRERARAAWGVCAGGGGLSFCACGGFER
jgi:hypothetical protein